MTGHPADHIAKRSVFRTISGNLAPSACHSFGVVKAAEPQLPASIVNNFSSLIGLHSDDLLNNLMLMHVYELFSHKVSSYSPLMTDNC